MIDRRTARRYSDTHLHGGPMLVIRKKGNKTNRGLMIAEPIPCSTEHEIDESSVFEMFPFTIGEFVQQMRKTLARGIFDEFLVGA